MSKRPRFKEGDRVILKANKREGWPEERAEVLGGPDHGAWMVRVDECYRNDGDGDGLREVGLNQLKKLDKMASTTGRVMAAALEGLLDSADSDDGPDCTLGEALEEALEVAGLLQDYGEYQQYVTDFSDCDAERLANVPRVRAALVRLVGRLIGSAQQVSDA